MSSSQIPHLGVSRIALPPDTPLYVDLDGTLLRTDTLHESALLLVRQSVWNVPRMLAWLPGGKAAFKRRVADTVLPEADTLPYHVGFLEWLCAEKAAGRRLVLATAADARIAQAVAQHLGLFDDVLASNSGADSVNLNRARKRDAIERHARAQGFERYAYAGNSADDLDVWAGAQAAVAVDTPAGVLRRLQGIHPQTVVFEREALPWRAWLKAVRVTQWAKNALLFLPLLAAHSMEPGAWLQVVWAFVAFGLCASATYLVNDLLDLPNDRRHAHKRHRPLAAGRVGVAAALALVPFMGLAAYGLAWQVSSGFTAMLALYTGVTLAYSARLKRVAVLDVLILAGLYSLRLVAGAVAAQVSLSNWLLAFSMFLFLGLALVKRCAELEEVKLSDEVSHARGRGYHQNDLPALRAMGMSSGFLTVMVLALYVDSQNGKALYAEPGWLWGAMPLLLWWIMRVWIKTGRRELHGEDPLLFALKDPFSWFVVLAVGVLGVAATQGW